MGKSLRRGRVIVLAIIAAALATELLASATAVSRSDAGSTSVSVFVSVLLAYFLYRGYEIARYLSAGGLFIGALLAGPLAAWGPAGHPAAPLLAGAAVLSGVMGLVLLLSGSVKAFLAAQLETGGQAFAPAAVSAEQLDPVGNAAGLQQAAPPDAKPYMFELACVFLLFAAAMAVVKVWLEWSPTTAMSGFILGELGVSMVVALVVALIPAYVFLHKKARPLLLCFSLVLCWVMAADVARRAAERPPSRQQMAAVLRELLAGKRFTREDLDARGLGPAAPALAIYSRFADRAVQHRETMMKITLDAAPGTLLTREALDSPEKIAAARERVKQSRGRLAEENASIQKTLDDLRDALLACDCPASFKQGIVEGAEKYIPEVRELFGKQDELVDRLFVEVDAELEFLQERPGTFGFDDNRIVFAADQAATVYNGHIAEIQRISGQLAELERNARHRAESSLDRLEDTEP